MKSVYSFSPDLQALNGRTTNETAKVNSRVQVLPVCWRHQIQFGLKKQESEAAGTKEQDIGYVSNEENTAEEEDESATLEDITIDTIPALRG